MRCILKNRGMAILTVLLIISLNACDGGSDGNINDSTFIFLNPTGLKVFIAGETNSYAIYGGDDIPIDNDHAFAIRANPENNGYLLLGTAIATAEFNGTYNYYLIKPVEEKPVTIDALQLLGTDRNWSGWVSLPQEKYGGTYGSCIEDMDKLKGPPDGESARFLAGEIDGMYYPTPFFLLAGDGWALPPDWALPPE